MNHTLVIALLVSTLLGLVWCEADYYKVLGVGRDADEKQIKSAYRSLSKKFHPDKNPGDDSAQQKFMEIGEAYEVLNDPEKRALYDRYGEEGVKEGANQQRGGGGGGDPFDMFANFFGGGGRSQQRGRPRGKPRGNDVSVDVTATLRDFYNGKSMDFEVELQDVCDECNGSGSADGQMHTCGRCHGRGRIVQKRQLAPGMIQQFEGPCPDCGGSGRQIQHKCKKCRGAGVFRNVRKYNLDVSPGAERNHVETFSGESDKSPAWSAGDLRVTIREAAENNMGYRRVGSNLYRSEVLSLKEALVGGWERDIPFLDSYEPSLRLHREVGKSVQDGEVEVVQGKGMPLAGNEDEHGDLFVEYRVVYPGGSSAALHKMHDEL